MIIDILSKLVLWLVDIIIGVLPGWKLPDFIVDSFHYFMFFLAGFARIIPVFNAVIVCLALIIIFKTSVILANLSIGFIALIRGSGKPEI